MLITEKWLNDQNACGGGIQWWKSLNTGKPEDIFRAAQTEEEFDYCVWMVKYTFNKKQAVEFSIFCAEKVLHFWEEKYPENDSPARAIEAAKKYLKRPCKETKDAAKDAANASAAAAAAYAASAAAAEAAVNAAGAAGAAAYAARSAIKYAARSAYNTAVAASGASVAAANAVESLRQEILEEAARIVAK